MPIELRPWGESDAEHLLRAFSASDDLATHARLRSDPAPEIELLKTR